jgi:hypothetical protein
MVAKAQHDTGTSWDARPLTMIHVRVSPLFQPLKRFEEDFAIEKGRRTMALREKASDQLNFLILSHQTSISSLYLAVKNNQGLEYRSLRYW